jgi:hypothetical protein
MIDVASRLPGNTGNENEDVVGGGAKSLTNGTEDPIVHPVCTNPTQKQPINIWEKVIMTIIPTKILKLEMIDTSQLLKALLPGRIPINKMKGAKIV